VQVSSERIVIFKLVEGREKAVQTLGYSDLLTAQPVSVQVHFLQCCGSGSGIRCIFYPGIRNAGWVINQDPDQG
jgi:hypothetical protein